MKWLIMLEKYIYTFGKTFTSELWSHVLGHINAKKHEDIEFKEVL